MIYLLIAILSVSCGHIKIGNFKITNPNSAMLNSFQIIFSLQTPLHKNEILRFQFPFPLHAASAN